MASINGNILANQSAYNPVPRAQATPYSQGMADFTGPFGTGTGLVRGAGTVQMGPAGISTSVPWAPGFSATPANTHNGLGLASPFATTNNLLQNISQNSFGQSNPFTPLIGTPWDIPNSLMALGSFGGLGSTFSPYTGSGIPQATMSDGSMGYGGPGGTAPGNMYNSPLFAGIPGAGGGPVIDASTYGLGGGGGAYGAPAGGGYGAPVGGGYPGLGGGGNDGGGLALGGGFGSVAPPAGYGGGGGGSFPDMLNNPGLFAPVDQNTIPGIAQVFTHQGEDFANRYSLISDGVARLFLQGQGDPNTPRQLWGSGGNLKTPYGIFETGVGWAGGNANAGVMGAQASGMSWAMVRNPINPAMITSYANPYYNNYNFNEGFTNA